MSACGLLLLLVCLAAFVAVLDWLWVAVTARQRILWRERPWRHARYDHETLHGWLDQQADRIARLEARDWKRAGRTRGTHE